MTSSSLFSAIPIAKPAIPAPLIREHGTIPNLNAVRILIVAIIAVGYASTMPIGPQAREVFAQFGYEPSLVGIQMLFFYSGFLALRSLRRHGSSAKYLASRFLRNGPILALYTLFVISLIYPIFGSFDSGVTQQISKLGKYLFLTATCIQPGKPLPGLLDDALYMCMIQSTVWTFRWGMLAHLAVATGNLFGAFNKDRLILAAAIGLTAVFGAAEYFVVKLELSDFLPLLPPLRLGYMFAIGMAAYAYQDRLPRRLWGRLLLLLALYGGTAFFHGPLMPWTPMIEIGLSLSWVWASYMLLTSRGPRIKKRLQNWPNLTLTLYLCIWPIAQIILLLRPELGSWGLIMLTLPASFSFAYLMYRFVARKCYARAEQISGLNVQEDKPGYTRSPTSSKAPLLSQL